MNNEQNSKIVHAGIIGTGQFATAIVTQSMMVERLHIPIVADVDVEAAQQAYQFAGIPAEEVAVCENRQSALNAIERGKRVIVPDASLMMDLPLDVVVEATGMPEAGVRHALAAIEYGKHVAMVNKETDATVGPMLSHLAAQAGVVYTQVDGDQHGLLIGLVQWAQELGLTVLSGGKSRDAEYIYDLFERTVTCRRRQIEIAEQDMQWLRPIPVGGAKEYVQARKALFAALPQVGGFDLVEMAIAANATGLKPDMTISDAGIAGISNIHCPSAMISEISCILCPEKDYGILQGGGIVDSVSCLRQAHEAGLGGGVFIVVSCENNYSQKILTTKGLIANHQDTTALIYRPHHLCGVETPITILCAGLLGITTGASKQQPVVDIVAKAKRTLHAGEIVGNDHSPDLEFFMQTATPITSNTPIPIHMANGNQLQTTVPAGTFITRDMVKMPENSALWPLRDQQDQYWI
ncbi:MAG: flagellar biosynthesis protein FlgA [Chloroflexota bacterium]